MASVTGDRSSLWMFGIEGNVAFTIEIRKIYWINTYNNEFSNFILHHKVMMTIIDTLNTAGGR